MICGRNCTIATWAQLAVTLPGWTSQIINHSFVMTTCAHVGFVKINL